MLFDEAGAEENRLEDLDKMPLDEDKEGPAKEAARVSVISDLEGAFRRRSCAERFGLMLTARRTATCLARGLQESLSQRVLLASSIPHRLPRFPHVI